MQDLPQGELIEELGEPLCQDAVAAGDQKNQDWEHPRPGQVTVFTSIGVDQIWRQAGLSQASALAGKCRGEADHASLSCSIHQHM